MTDSTANEPEVKQLHDQINDLTANNQRLSTTLREAREQLITLKEEVERLSGPPNGYAIYDGPAANDMVNVNVNGRKMRVSIAPSIDQSTLQFGQEVILNEAMNVVVACGFEEHGELAVFKEMLEDGRRALVYARGSEERVVRLAAPLIGVELKSGDSVLCDTRSGYAVERIAKSEVEDLQLEEVPDISYEDIGGLTAQIDMIRDSVELPFLHPELFKEYELKPPKGILLYGPPGCGKTLIAKAVANSLAKKTAEIRGVGEGKSYFLNIKGPELLNKFVGETERQIRVIFQKAREHASAGTPVIVFFDEMDSLFRTRGSGVSSDVENTIVPQLLAEIDGVETLENVIVIGASNREDMIDPAILRPGRLDVKIKIERPDAPAANDIFKIYLTSDVPLHPDAVAAHGGDLQSLITNMVDSVIERTYALAPENEFLEVTYANGDKEIMYFMDFMSGAMIENIVSRAKKAALKSELETGVRGITLDQMMTACYDEFRENEDLPNTTNPDDWARISGKKGERIAFMRTLIHGNVGVESGRSIDTTVPANPYV